MAWRTLFSASTPGVPASVMGPTLRLAFAIGAALSFLNGGHLGPGRLAPAMLCVSFVPLLRMAVFLLVATLLARPHLRTMQHLRLHGAGYRPWYVWLLAISLLHILRPSWPSGVDDRLLGLSLLAAVAWSLTVRFAFWRTALGLSGRRAVLALALTAALFWAVVSLFFFASDQLAPRVIGRV